ncbi:MAG: hypothetical protein A4E28_02170 [Methanocella sp. PtaU1.Bin125]|nr:MAG: hypothetical protein A4E28_02170 [Methanocella sp. PtaU1.Bin125]
MASFKKNDEAVSAVIGVILMVAITVILAAVIAAFVFQLGGNVPKQKNVAVEVARVNQTAIYVKVMGGTDVAQLIDASATQGCLNVTVNGIESTNIVTSGSPVNDNQVGSLQYYACAANSQVSVVGNFKDNTQTVLWTGTIQ